MSMARRWESLMMWGYLREAACILTGVAVVSMAIYALLLSALGRALEASSAVGVGVFYGPETLFALMSLALGWTTISLLERRLGIRGPILLAVAMPSWVVATSGGFVIGAVLEEIRDFWVLLSACTATTAVAAAVRVWWPE